MGAVIVNAFSPEFPSIAGTFEIQGSGFSLIEGVEIGGTPQTITFQSDTLIRLEIVAGTPLGEQPLELFGEMQSLVTLEAPTVIDLLIEELDARAATPGLDFVQLRTSVSLTLPLSEYTLAFINGDGPGGTNVVSHSFVLSASTLFDGSYLVAAPSFMPTPQQSLPFIDIPPGTDAVVIYQQDIPFPPNAAAPVTGIIDALVFNGPDPDPAPALTPQFMLVPGTITEDPTPNSFSLRRCGSSRRNANEFQRLPPDPTNTGSSPCVI
jgi:hypothetical protein